MTGRRGNAWESGNDRDVREWPGDAGMLGKAGMAGKVRMAGKSGICRDIPQDQGSGVTWRSHPEKAPGAGDRRKAPGLTFPPPLELEFVAVKILLPAGTASTALALRWV
ncbi:unnamed protein product [Coccothraustes coccothraustes]